MVLSVIISDQSVISNSTKVHSATLASQYDEILLELKGEGGPVELNGEESYDPNEDSITYQWKFVSTPQNSRCKLYK